MNSKNDQLGIARPHDQEGSIIGNVNGSFAGSLTLIDQPIHFSRMDEGIFGLFYAMTKDQTEFANLNLFSAFLCFSQLIAFSWHAVEWPTGRLYSVLDCLLPKSLSPCQRGFRFFQHCGSVDCFKALHINVFVFVMFFLHRRSR